MQWYSDFRVRVAAFSPYHFHRLFSAWQGERLGDYIRRRRVELGASRLAAQPSLTYGSPEEIGDAWAALLRDWLPSSGLQLDSRPCFEYYPADGHEDPETRAFGCQICVPVAAL